MTSTDSINPSSPPKRRSLQPHWFQSSCCQQRRHILVPCTALGNGCHSRCCHVLWWLLTPCLQRGGTSGNTRLGILALGCIPAGLVDIILEAFIVRCLHAPPAQMMCMCSHPSDVQPATLTSAGGSKAPLPSILGTVVHQTRQAAEESNSTICAAMKVRNCCAC